MAWNFRWGLFLVLFSTSAYASMPRLVVWVPGTGSDDEGSVERVLSFHMNDQKIATSTKQELFPEGRHWDQTTLVLATALRNIPAVVRVNRVKSTALTAPDGTKFCQMEVEASVLPAAMRFEPLSRAIGVEGHCFSPLLGNALRVLAERIANDLGPPR